MVDKRKASDVLLSLEARVEKVEIALGHEFVHLKLVRFRTKCVEGGSGHFLILANDLE